MSIEDLNKPKLWLIINKVYISNLLKSKVIEIFYN